MSTHFEAVVLAAQQSALVPLLESLAGQGPLGRISFELFPVADQGWVIFGWRAGAKRPHAADEMEEVAHALSRAFAAAITVHYDDQIGLRLAMLSRNGLLVRHFGEEDEVWVPYADDGELVMDGPRYSGKTVPDDVECDCIWNGIDAALDAAGFRDWITGEKVCRVAQESDPIWQRAGIPQ